MMADCAISGRWRRIDRACWGWDGRHDVQGMASGMASTKLSAAANGRSCRGGRAVVASGMQGAFELATVGILVSVAAAFASSAGIEPERTQGPASYSVQSMVIGASIPRTAWTGQAWAAASSLMRCLLSNRPGICRCTEMLDILLGAFGIVLVTVAVAPTMSISIERAAMPMMLRMQLPSETASRSLGEKPCPYPLLSLGASVSTTTPESACCARHRNAPSYETTVSVIYLATFALRHTASE